MGDMGDMWRECKAEWQAEKEERKRNWLASTLPKVMQKLVEAGCEVEKKNGGCHWVVSKRGFVFDYWPTKSKRWMLRGTKQKGFGVHSLLNFASKDR